MDAFAWTVPADAAIPVDGIEPGDDVVTGTWRFTGPLDMLNQTAEVEVTGTLTADGARAYQGFDVACAIADTAGVSRAKGKAVPFAFAADAKLHINLITDRIDRVTLDTKDTLFAADGLERLQEGMALGLADFPVSEFID
jgi:hypothetical protein